MPPRPSLSAITVSSDTSNFVVVNPTTTDHILVVLPGETAAPGSSRGFTGTPASATAGIPYISSVTVTDRFYNIKTSPTPQIQMITTDPYDVDPATRVVNGVTQFPITFVKAPGPWTVTVSTTPSYIGQVLVSTTSDLITVHAGAPSKLQVLLPGQSPNPGKPPYDNGQNGGYNGSLSPFTAGNSFSVTVNLVDNYFNQSQSADTFVQLMTNDPFAAAGVAAIGSQQTGANPNPTGRTVFSNVTMITRSTATWQWQIFASTATGDPYAQAQSTWVVVQAAAAQKLLVLAPGETSQEGNVPAAAGKYRPPNPSFTVGTTYYVQVRAVDSYFNIVTTTNPVITLNSDDPNAIIPSTDTPKIMSGGVISLPFMLKTSEVYPNGIKTTLLTGVGHRICFDGRHQSGGLVMAATTYAGIQILVPPQIGVPGSATGKNVNNDQHRKSRECPSTRHSHRGPLLQH